MADEKYTRCPGCRTIFRVTREQLALRNGQVRCGHCRTVFDGVAQLISLAPLPRDIGTFEHDAGPPTVTLRNARALEPVALPGETRPATPAPVAEPEVDYEDRFAWDRPSRPSKSKVIGYALATTALTLLLLLQAVHHFRDGVAARWPSMRPALSAICSVAKCEIHPLHEIGFLSIEASDLQADPAHRGLLILTATVRNRAAAEVAYPYVELTLTDAQDRIVVRRAIAPSEYLSAGANVARGIPASGEVALKLFIDASATTQAGYRVYLFYP